MKAWNDMEEVALDLGALSNVSLHRDKIILPYSGPLTGEMYGNIEIAAEVTAGKELKRAARKSTDRAAYKAYERYNWILTKTCTSFGFIENLKSVDIQITVPSARRANKNSIFYLLGTRILFTAFSPVLDMEVSSHIAIRMSNEEVRDILERFFGAGAPGIRERDKAYHLNNYKTWTETVSPPPSVPDHENVQIILDGRIYNLFSSGSLATA